MVASGATTVAEYLKALPEDRRREIAKVRTLVRKHLPSVFKECMQYGMISWVIPLARYPETYNQQPLAIASLASQKNYASLHLLGVYAIEAERKRFESGYRKSGKKLNMGKSCVRFANCDDLALDVIADTISRVTVDALIGAYEASRTPAQRAARNAKSRPKANR